MFYHLVITVSPEAEKEKIEENFFVKEMNKCLKLIRIVYFKLANAITQLVQQKTKITYLQHTYIPVEFHDSSLKFKTL